MSRGGFNNQHEAVTFLPVCTRERAVGAAQPADGGVPRWKEGGRQGRRVSAWNEGNENSGVAGIKYKQT